jgi:hypothetical protein
LRIVFFPASLSKDTLTQRADCQIVVFIADVCRSNQ